jgi:peptidoglycan hydrolase CwlO-like protein
MNQELILLISNILTAVAGWFIGRRKSNAETDNTILQGVEQSVSIYKDVVDSLKIEIERLHVKIDQLEKKIEELIKENHELKGYGKGL